MNGTEETAGSVIVRDTVFLFGITVLAAQQVRRAGNRAWNNIIVQAWSRTVCVCGRVFIQLFTIKVKATLVIITKLDGIISFFLVVAIAILLLGRIKAIILFRTMLLLLILNETFLGTLYRQFHLSISTFIRRRYLKVLRVQLG